MTYQDCSNKVRESIKEDVKQNLLRWSNFSCSICGDIPVVFHHIEEWAKTHSNEEKYIMPICDTCHRSIHGEGGPIYSKAELYKYKLNPKKPEFLKYKYSLENKPNYSFFVGSNFIANGEKATLIKIGEFPLTVIDTSSGVLRLSILSGVKNNIPFYLIKNNELVVDTHDIWKMKFSIPILKIWKMVGDKKIVFINITIKSDIIIIREMNTEFNGKSFFIHKPPTPHKRQIKEVDSLVKAGEKYFRNASKLIDKQTKTEGIVNGVNIDELIKKNRKDKLKKDIEFKLRDIIKKQFKLDFYSSYFILDKALKKSNIFRRRKDDFLNHANELSKTIDKIKKKYKKEFEELDGTVVNYNGMILSNNYSI